jgi:outer membrane protein assembly factor BamD
MVEAYQRLGMDDLAATSLSVLKHNYPDNPSLVDGNFVPRLDEEDQQSWLTRATLGLIESDEPLPPGETRASRDIQREYEAAKARIPRELQPEAAAQPAAAESDEDAEESGWLDFLTPDWFSSDSGED